MKNNMKKDFISEISIIIAEEIQFKTNYDIQDLCYEFYRRSLISSAESECEKIRITNVIYYMRIFKDCKITDMNADL